VEAVRTAAPVAIALAVLALLPWSRLRQSPTPPAPPAAPAALHVVDEARGESIAVLPVAGDSLLELRYVHSVYHQPAVEEFAVRPDGLRLVRLTSPSVAVLEYYARPEPVTPTDTGFEIRLATAERYPRLEVLVGEVGQRTVVYAGRELPLYRLAGEGVRVGLTVTQGERP
jgi:hypothetical protein